MEIMATSKNYGKKEGSDHFRDILNPYGEKSNYGKIGRRRRLSKLNGFFSIILSVTIRALENSNGKPKQQKSLWRSSYIRNVQGSRNTNVIAPKYAKNTEKCTKTHGRQ